LSDHLLREFNAFFLLIAGSFDLLPAQPLADWFKCQLYLLLAGNFLA
jgi:hypothetical protein